MFRFILFIITLSIPFKYGFAESNVVDLIPQNPNVESNNEESSSSIEINGQINEIDLKLSEGDEVVIFNNNNDLNNVEEFNDSSGNLSDVWKDSDIENINFLFESLNYDIKSKTIKSNLVNSLIYGTEKPNSISQEEFDKIRILELKKLGEVEAAINVISNISTYENNKDIYDKIILEKSLVDYNLAAVCGVLESDSEFNIDEFLTKIKVFCSFLNI